MDLSVIGDFFAVRFDNGQAVNALMAVVVVQALAFALFAKTWRARVGFLVAAAPLVCLLFAVRAALIGAPWWAVAFWVALAWPLHLLDLARRSP